MSTNEVKGKIVEHGLNDANEWVVSGHEQVSIAVNVSGDDVKLEFHPEAEQIHFGKMTIILDKADLERILYGGAAKW